MKKITKNILLIGVLSVVLTGCQKEEIVKDYENKTGYYPVELDIVDDNGVESIEVLNKEPEKVVVLGEALVEYMLAFDQKEKIVGIGYLDGEDFNSEELKSLNIINKLWPSRESIIALNPDLIYSMSSGFKEDRVGLMDFWKERDINTLPAINFTVGRNNEEYEKDLLNFGRAFNIEKEVSEFLEEENEKIFEYLGKIDNSDRVLFLSISGGKYYYCPPKGSMMDDVIEDIGSEFLNLSDDQFIEVSKEAIIKENPDKIILAEYQREDKNGVYEDFIKDTTLKNVKAVKNKDILVVDYTSAVRGNLEMSDLYREVYEFLLKDSDSNW